MKAACLIQDPDIRDAIADIDQAYKALKAQLENELAHSHHVMEAIDALETDVRWLRRRIVIVTTSPPRPAPGETT